MTDELASPASPRDARLERDGSHALAAVDGYDPLSIESEGEQDHVRFLHRVTFFWNERGQFMIQVWNESANVQGAGAKALTVPQAKELLAYLKRTISEIEGHS